MSARRKQEKPAQDVASKAGKTGQHGPIELVYLMDISGISNDRVVICAIWVILRVSDMCAVGVEFMILGLGQFERMRCSRGQVR